MPKNLGLQCFIWFCLHVTGLSGRLSGSYSIFFPRHSDSMLCACVAYAKVRQARRGLRHFYGIARNSGSWKWFGRSANVDTRRCGGRQHSCFNAFATQRKNYSGNNGGVSKIIPRKMQWLYLFILRFSRGVPSPPLPLYIIPRNYSAKIIPLAQGTPWNKEGTVYYKFMVLSSGHPTPGRPRIHLRPCVKCSSQGPQLRTGS